MNRRSRDDGFDPQSCLDADLRKKVFREMGGDFLRSFRAGYVTDGPGGVAALMEKAFRAGAELAGRKDFSLTGRDTLRDVTDMDVPSAPRKSMNSMRVWLGVDMRGGAYSHDETEIECCQIGFIMRPGHPGVPATSSKDDWLMGYPSPGCQGRGMRTYSNKSMLPLVKMGLMANPRDLGNGWKGTCLTEWGFELFLTGRTSGPDSRQKGKSSTYALYRRLFDHGSGPIAEAAYSLGLLERPDAAPPGPRH